MSEPISTSRSGRRTRVKVVDYSFEQQFSDDDIFEDNLGKDDNDADEPPMGGASSSRRKTSRPRKSNVGGNFDGGTFGSSTGKPVYTERGYDPSLPPIRERFSFEPEYEPDGTPKIELIVGRRPIEDTKDRTQTSGEGDLSDNDCDDANHDSRHQRQQQQQQPQQEQDENSPPQSSEMDYEYLLKYKGRSYLHLEWKTAADLESMNKTAKTIYRRYLKKLAAGTEEDLEDPTFDPAYTEPGRILAEEDHEIMVELTDKELVKWEKEREKQWDDLGVEGDEEDEEEESAEENEKEKTSVEGDEEVKVEEKLQKEQEKEITEGQEDKQDEVIGTSYC